MQCRDTLRCDADESHVESTEVRPSQTSFSDSPVRDVESMSNASREIGHVRDVIVKRQEARDRGFAFLL